MNNYAATVVKIDNVRPHSNADRLVCTNIFGNNIIVGKETKIGDIGLYFPLESQLGEDFAKNNDLIRRKDGSGKPAGGMFDENRRVRCQTFRGEKSMGFFIPIDSLENLSTFTNKWPLDKSHLVIGNEIDTYCGYTISTKYIPKTNRTPGASGSKLGRKSRESKIIPGQFHFHTDTSQLGKNMHKINPDDLIVLTWKMHGTSAIVSNCLVKKPIHPFLKFLRLIGVPIVDTHYEYILASRRVIKNEFAEFKDHFYGVDTHTLVGKEVFEGTLKHGETVYYEIVGYNPNGSAIQGDWDYGCHPGGFKVYVYRITRTNPDGTVTELQCNQVKERSKEIGVETVPEIFYGAADITFCPGDDIEEWRKKYLSWLQIRFVYDQDSQFCRNKVAEEGICLRKEGLQIETYKLKSFRFLKGESEQLDKGVVDTETAESI